MPKAIIKYTTVYAPWKDGEDEPDIVEEDNERFNWRDYSDDSAVAWALSVLDEIGCTEASASYFCPRVWYSGSYQDYYDGTTTEVSCHLVCFSKPEKERIFKRFLLRHK